MNVTERYKKNLMVSNEDGMTKAMESVKTIVYSTDPRDMGLVRKSIPCQNACPAKTNIPGYIRCIHEGRYGRSYELNRMANILPGVLGRICSKPCELFCRHGESDLGKSVSICSLKRSAADLKSPLHRIMEGLYSPSGKTVAVVGAGPAGLGAAHELSVLGHRVVLFEAFDKPGGMLMYGIPEFRLPRDVLMLEVENILRLGVVLKTGVRVGRDISLDELLSEFEAVVITTGCPVPNRLNVPGEDLENVYPGLEFMERVNRGEKPYVGKTVMVIGDGFTAMDCARSALRLGATEVKINIRKTEEYMPIDDLEKHEVKFEKIRFYSLVDTQRILGENGRVTGIEFLRTKLEYSPSPPYRTASVMPDSEFIVPADSVIVAIGQRPEPSGVSASIEADGSRIRTVKDRFSTNIKGVFAAGDCMSGASNVISAISRGRNCALDVDEYLTGRKRKIQVVRLESVPSTDRDRSYDFIPRTPMDTLDFDQRVKPGNPEVEKGYTAEQAADESKRCYLCSLVYTIDTSRCIYCSACIDVAPRDCIKMAEDVPVMEDGSLSAVTETKKWNRVAAIAIDNERCIRCGKCYEVCPMNCIHVTKTELIELNIED